MQKIYRIVDWDRNFENAKSRGINHLSWCPITNKQDGLGYSRLMAHKDAAAIYGAFVAVVLRASRQPSPRQGYLTDTGYPDGVSLSSADLSMITKVPEEYIATMLDVCSSEDIGWIEVYDEKDTSGILEGYEVSTKYPLQEGTEQKEQNRMNRKAGCENAKNKKHGSASEKTSEKAREVWECEALSQVWPRCGDGWSHAGELDFAAKAADTSVERFTAMLWQKAQVPHLKNPAAAAIAAFRKGWAPTDGALAQVKAMLHPDEGEREGLYLPDLTRNNFRDTPEYQKALGVFRRLRGVFENQGITCVEELMMTKEWADMRDD